MKGWGITFLVFAGLNLLRACAAAMNDAMDLAVMNCIYTLMLCVLGGYLIHRANQKEKEKEDKEKWDKDE